MKRVFVMVVVVLGVLGVASLAVAGKKKDREDGRKIIRVGPATYDVTGATGVSSAKIVAELRGGRQVDLTDMDEEAFKELIMREGHLSVGALFQVGDELVVLDVGGMTFYKELLKLRKRLDKAVKKVEKFLKSSKTELVVRKK